MSKLFPPADKVHFSKVELNGSISRQWTQSGLDMKAYVVCDACNGNWMSQIEDRHAKPAMADLILGNRVGEITPDRAQSISLFAFKTAVIANHMLPEDEEFFDISDRYAFRESRAIPPKVGMYLFGVERGLTGGIRSVNVHFPDKDTPKLTLNVCSFYVGQFGFQVVSAKTLAVQQIESLPTPKDLTVMFYPEVRSGVSWPGNVVLGREAFDDLAYRWNSVKYK